jgi:hypothetical protein
MPIMHDIMDPQIVGPAIRQGLQQGLQQGMQQGMQQEGISILRRQIEKRFGSLPASAEERLVGLSIAELEDLSLHVLDARSMDDLFDRRAASSERTVPISVLSNVAVVRQVFQNRPLHFERIHLSLASI